MKIIMILTLITFLACERDFSPAGNPPEPVVDPFRELIKVGIANRYQEGFEIWYDVELRDLVIYPILVEIVREDRDGIRHPVPPWECFYNDEEYHYYMIYRLPSNEYYAVREVRFLGR